MLIHNGGVAYDAAVISRERGKPTRTGTRSATSQVHTCNPVEVDTYGQVLERDTVSTLVPR